MVSDVLGGCLTSPNLPRAPETSPGGSGRLWEAPGSPRKFWELRRCLGAHSAYVAAVSAWVAAASPGGQLRAPKRQLAVSDRSERRQGSGWSFVTYLNVVTIAFFRKTICPQFATVFHNTRATLGYVIELPTTNTSTLMAPMLCRSRGILPYSS